MTVVRLLYPNGTVRVEKWYRDGVLHREDGPAVIGYYLSGKVELEKWYVNGKLLQSKSKPAVVRYYLNGRTEEFNMADSVVMYSRFYDLESNLIGCWPLAVSTIL